MIFSYYFRPIVILSILLVVFIYLITPLLFIKKTIDNQTNQVICGTVKSYQFKSYNSYYFYIKGDQTFLVKSQKKFNVPLYSKICIKGDIKEISSKEYFGNFSWKKYMNMKNIFWQIELKEVVKYDKSLMFFEIVNTIRIRFIEFIEKNFIREDNKSIIFGLVLGDKQNLSRELKDAMTRCGLMHLMVASGSNISYFIGIFVVLFRFIGINRKIAFLISLIAGLVYVVLIGFEPPITRAYLMIFFGFLFYFINRNIDSFQILFIVFLIVVILNPISIYDPSFVMSFLCVYGIIVGFMSWNSIFIDNFKFFKLSPFDGKYKLFVKENINKGLMSIVFLFFITFFSQIALSIYIYTHFYRFSIISFISNILLIPLASIIVTLSVLSIIIDFIFSINSLIFLVEWVISLFIKLIYFFSSFKYSIFYFSPVSNINAFLIFIFFIIFLHLPAIKFSNILSKVFISIIFLLLFLSFLWKDPVKDDIFLEVGRKRVWFIERNLNYYLIDPIIEADKIINMVYASRRNRIDYILVSSYSTFREKHIKKLKKVFNVKKIYIPIWLCKKYDNYSCIFGGESGEGFKAIFKDKYGYFNVYSNLIFCFNDDCF